MNRTNPRVRLLATALLALVLLTSCSTHREFAAARGDYADASFVHYAMNVVDKKYYAPSRLNYALMYNGALAGMAEYLKKNDVVYAPPVIPANTNEADCQKVFNAEFAKASALNARAADPSELAFAATAAMLETMKSSHTGFMPPAVYQQYMRDQAGTAAGYAGIGVKIGKVYLPKGTAGEDCWYLAQVFANGPADRAGLKEYDELVAVDGAPIATIADDIAKYVRGVANTPVVLDIRRSGHPMTVTVTRADVFAPNLESHVIEIDGRRFYYVRFYRFHPVSGGALLILLASINRNGQNPVDGIILDLRSDPGGYISVLDDVLNALLPGGKVTAVEVQRNKEVTHRTNANAGAYADIPLIVLANESSYSAAEMCSSALKINLRAKVVGVKTGGKVETSLKFPLSYEAGISVAIAQALDANRVDLENNGVDPDIAVAITKDDIAVGRDSQLDAAVKELLSEIK